MTLYPGMIELRAMYVIEAGEEVTINYMSMVEEGSEVRRVRQRYLSRWYGFHCSCATCSRQVRPLCGNITIPFRDPS